jgi:hypothetical protein
LILLTFSDDSFVLSSSRASCIAILFAGRIHIWSIISAHTIQVQIMHIEESSSLFNSKYNSSRFLFESFLESFKLFIILMFFFFLESKNTAPATTGPAHGHLQASSIPIIESILKNII